MSNADAFGKNYYLIPDGKGHWKKTDPRVDRNRVSEINVKNDGNVLNVIRAVKYWQRRPTMPTMSSYLLETMILDYYTNKTDCLKYIDMELQALFNHLGLFVKEGANKQVISSQADSLIKISRIWADFFPANTSNQPI